MANVANHRIEHELAACDLFEIHDPKTEPIPGLSPGLSSNRNSTGKTTQELAVTNLRKRIVFVVDDEQVIAETLAMILNQAGFIALSFQDPRMALAAAGFGSSPDLLISDVVMPQLSGIELAIRFRRSYPKCKILLFSGQAATSNLLESARKQGYEFEVLSKPVHPSDLLAKVREFSQEDENAPAETLMGPNEHAMP